MVFYQMNIIQGLQALDYTSWRKYTDYIYTGFRIPYRALLVFKRGCSILVNNKYYVCETVFGLEKLMF